VASLPISWWSTVKVLTGSCTDQLDAEQRINHHAKSHSKQTCTSIGTTDQFN